MIAYLSLICAVVLHGCGGNDDDKQIAAVQKVVDATALKDSLTISTETKVFWRIDESKNITKVKCSIEDLQAALKREAKDKFEDCAEEPKCEINWFISNKLNRLNDKSSFDKFKNDIDNAV